MSELELRHNSEAFRYEGWIGTELATQADYRIEDGVVVVTHTGTAPNHRRRGYAGELVCYMLDDLLGSNTPVKPMCPFVASFIEEHPKYQRLVRG